MGHLDLDNILNRHADAGAEPLAADPTQPGVELWPETERRIKEVVRQVRAERAATVRAFRDQADADRTDERNRASDHFAAEMLRMGQEADRNQFRRQLVLAAVKHGFSAAGTVAFADEILKEMDASEQADRDRQRAAEADSP